MNATYVIEFNVRQGQRDRFLELLYPVLDTMRHEPMFVSAFFAVDPENDHRFLLHETWRDHQDVLDVQLQRPYRAEWHAALPELLVEERRIGIWLPLRSDVAPTDVAAS